MSVQSYPFPNKPLLNGGAYWAFFEIFDNFGAVYACSFMENHTKYRFRRIVLLGGSRYN